MKSPGDADEDLQLLVSMIPNNENCIGIDEVGRGCLFGPVFAGAVLLTNRGEERLLKAGVKDSKALSKKERQRLFPLIKAEASEWSLGQSSAREIDAFGIRKATELSMVRALQKISNPFQLVRVDGSLPIRLWAGKQQTLIKGDNICTAIAAASVIAKVARDLLMERLSKKFPEYSLNKNAGYGTKFHTEILKTIGATPLHRKSFLRKILL